MSIMYAPVDFRSMARIISYDPLMTSDVGYYVCDQCGVRFSRRDWFSAIHNAEHGDFTTRYTTSDSEMLIAIHTAVHGEGMAQFEAENFVIHVQKSFPEDYWPVFQVFRSSCAGLDDEKQKRMFNLQQCFLEALTVECRKIISDLRHNGRDVSRKAVSMALVARFNGLGVDNARRAFDLMETRNTQAMNFPSANGDTIIEAQVMGTAVLTFTDEEIKAILGGLIKSLSASDALANGWVINQVRLGKTEEQGVTLVMCDKGDQMTIRAAVWGKTNDEAMVKAVQFSHENTPHEYYEAVYGLPYESVGVGE